MFDVPVTEEEMQEEMERIEEESYQEAWETVGKEAQSGRE